ncbi:MAG: hypothetical protein ACFCVE_15965, partial [Phycisphaerae bacterium]
GIGTYVTFNSDVIFFATSDPSINSVTIPTQMGISDAGGWAYSASLPASTSQTVVTDAGRLLTTGDEFLTGVFAAGSVFNVRMAGNGDVYAVVNLGPDAATWTDRSLVRIRDYDTTPTFEIVIQGGTGGVGSSTVLPGGLTVGSNSTTGSLPRQGGISDDYNVSTNGRYVVAGVDVQGAGITGVNDKTVFLTDLSTGDRTVLYREGDPTGDGDNFDNLGGGVPVQVNNNGTVLSAGDTDGNTAADGYLALGADIIAREGDVISGITLNAIGSIALNNLDQHLSVWTAKNGGPETVFFGEGDGPLVPLIGVGDTFSYYDDLSQEMLNATILDIESQQIALTDDGRGYLVVEFASGGGFSPFIGVIEVTIPEPTSGVVLVGTGLMAMRRRRQA